MGVGRVRMSRSRINTFSKKLERGGRGGARERRIALTHTVPHFQVVKHPTDRIGHSDTPKGQNPGEGATHALDQLRLVGCFICNRMCDVAQCVQPAHTEQDCRSRVSHLRKALHVTVTKSVT